MSSSVALNMPPRASDEKARGRLIRPAPPGFLRALENVL
jgi:hypothetical protein